MFGGGDTDMVVPSGNWKYKVQYGGDREMMSPPVEWQCKFWHAGVFWFI